MTQNMHKHRIPRANRYKFWRNLHLWLAIPFGLLISLICLTGFILLFQPSNASGAERPEFFMNVMRLHRWLMDAPPQKGMMTVGKVVVGITTIAFVVIVISGIILWIYRLKGGLGRNLKISVTKGWHTFWSTLHSSGGIYVAVILLILALTGLTWSFGWYREWFNALFEIQKGSHAVAGVHTGGFGGIITKIIWGITALLGFTLPLTGYYLWLHRINKRNR